MKFRVQSSAARSALVLLITFAISLAVFATDTAKLTADLASNDRDTRRNASHELLQLGPAAKPALTALITALDDQDRQVWSNSIGALANIGPDAKDAIPKLIASFDTRNSRGFSRRGGGQVPFRAAHALAKIGDAAKPALFDALKADDAGIRAGAAKALGAMGAKDAIPALIENLGHGDDTLRAECAEALSLIGTPAVQPLIASLGGTESRLREAAVRALAAIGKDAAPAGDALLKMAREEKDTSTRAAAFIALPKIGIAQEKFIPPLIAAIQGDSDDLRRAATNALLTTRPAAPHVVPALIALLKEPAHADRAAALLGRCGADAKGAVPALIALAPGSAAARDAIVLIGAHAVPALLDSLGKLEPAALSREHWAVKTLAAIGLPAVPALTKSLTAKKPAARLAALGTLNELGDDARDARPAILALAGDPEPLIRATVLSALVSLGGKSAQAIEHLDTASRDKSPIVRIAAATAAAALGAGARPLAARLGEMLDDTDPAVRIATLRALGPVAGENETLAKRAALLLADKELRPAAIEALAKLGAKAAAPQLTEIYPSADKPARLAILTALGASGETATLTTALTDTDADIRAAALRALGAARPADDILIPALTTALADTEIAVRRAAAEIAGDIGAKEPDRTAPLFPAFIAMLARDSDRTFTLDTLRAIRTRDTALIVTVLEAPNIEGKIWAVERLGRIGRQARGVREKIEPHLESSNDYLRRAARRALDSIGR